MVKRVLIGVAIGVGLAIVSQILLLGISMLAGAVGLHVYESAPTAAASDPAWVQSMNLLFLLTAIPMLIVTYVVGLLMRVAGLGDGAVLGVTWAVVVLLVFVVIGLGNGTIAILTTLGAWVFFAAVLVCPVLAGLRPRPARAARAV
ncbi:hypothetical protein [Raineyella fluvialis]|uniref:Uncharacterized protein n=1 Tax=Raineyella fluvialis TaxID=2662261 RepID=A0A5Q2F9Q0_9ACTN|nr:hypothetical protein [Raineyella fluvialis]QGF22467.1 hypothetical protein Rai3103_00805 [Raineyella fluvialis]